MEDLWWRSRLLQISGKTHAQLSQVLKILDYLLSHLWLSGSSWLIISISFYFFLLTPQTSSLFIHWCTFTCMAESVGCSVVSWLFGTPWTIAHQAPMSMGFSKQEYWSGLPCPSPENLPNPGLELRSLVLQADSLPSEPPGKLKNTGVSSLSLLQGIFPTQESTQGLLHCRQILYQPPGVQSLTPETLLPRQWLAL